MKGSTRFALVDLAWNNYRWEKTSEFVRSDVPWTARRTEYEHLNFKFDKECDDDKHVYGYAAAFDVWRKFLDGGIIFFMSVNKSEERNIVGIYGHASQIKTKECERKVSDPEYKNGLLVNMRAEKEYSLYLPVYLNYWEYFGDNDPAPIKYIEETHAKKILIDSLQKFDGHDIDKSKLRLIFELVTGKPLDAPVGPTSISKQPDEETKSGAEQSASDACVQTIPASEIIRHVERMLSAPEYYIRYKGLRLKRDMLIPAYLKKKRGYRCQLCGVGIKRKNDVPYVEAAHIQPKREGGKDTPDNFIILCPNHHKEFDHGDVMIEKKSHDEIKFVMNGVSYRADLSM